MLDRLYRLLIIVGLILESLFVEGWIWEIVDWGLGMIWLVELNSLSYWLVGELRIDLIDWLVMLRFGGSLDRRMYLLKLL
jgi:hypothetical protein